MPAVKDPATGKFVSPNAQDDPNKKAADAPPDKKEEQVDTAGLVEFSRRFAGEEPKDVPPKKPEEKKPADKKLEAKKPAAKPAPAKSNTEAILERTAATLEKVAGQLPGAAKTKEEPDKPDPLKDLSPSEKRRVTVLKQMETDFPDKYKGLSEKYLTGQKSLQEYAAKWMKDHPDQEFDEEAEEHQDFFERNNVDWDDDDYIDSFTNLKAEEKTKSAIEEAKRETNSKLSELERRNQLQDAAPTIAKEGIAAGRNFWKTFDETLADVLRADGTVDSEKLTAMQKENPTRFKVATIAADRVENLTGNMYKLLNGLEAFDDKNEVHKKLVDFALTKERELMERPETDRRDQKGREFKPRKEYRALKPEDRDKYWTFNATDFGYLLAFDEASKAKAYLDAREEEFRQEAEARGIKLPEKTEKTAQTLPDKKTNLQNGEEEEEQFENNDNGGKPHSPSTHSEPKVAARAGKDGAAPVTGVESFLKRQIAKS